MSKLTLGAEILGADPRLVGFTPKYEFKDGKKGAQIGTTLEVLMPHAGFAKIRVSIPDLSIPITEEEIHARNARFDPIKVQFEGFSASPYVDKGGNISYSAKASKVIFVGLKKTNY